MMNSNSNNNSIKHRSHLINSGTYNENGADYSEEVQDIIGKPPHWLVQWGMVVFLVVLALVFCIAGMVSYPEVINGEVKLTGIRSPNTIRAKLDTNILKLFVSNGSLVKEGEILAWLECTADHATVLDLSSNIDSLAYWLKTDNLNAIKSFETSKFSRLGSLQAEFESFEQIHRQFLSYRPSGYYWKKKEFIAKEIEYNTLQLKSLLEQKEIQENRFKIAQDEFWAQKKLAEKNVISSIDLGKSQKNLLSNRLPIKQIESSIISLKMLAVSKKYEMMELNKEIIEQNSIYNQALNSLENAIEDWKSKYILASSISGKVVFPGFFKEGRFFKAGEEIIFIKPSNVDFFGEMLVSQDSFGKLQEGQSVIVSFSGYPYQEFGTVLGNVSYISDFPVNKNNFVAKVVFDSGLVTNYGYNLTPVNGMIGQAEIITHDLTVLERFFKSISSNLY